MRCRTKENWRANLRRLASGAPESWRHNALPMPARRRQSLARFCPSAHREESPQAWKQPAAHQQMKCIRLFDQFVVAGRRAAIQVATDTTGCWQEGQVFAKEREPFAFERDYRCQGGKIQLFGGVSP